MSDPLPTEISEIDPNVEAWQQLMAEWDSALLMLDRAKCFEPRAGGLVYDNDAVERAHQHLLEVKKRIDTFISDMRRVRMRPEGHLIAGSVVRNATEPRVKSMRSRGRRRKAKLAGVK